MPTNFQMSTTVMSDFVPEHISYTLWFCDMTYGPADGMAGHGCYKNPYKMRTFCDFPFSNYNLRIESTQRHTIII